MVHRVHLFAMLRERAGSEVVEVDLDPGATVADALQELRRRQDSLASAVTEMSLVMAVNRDYARPDTVLAAGDEIALIPPVSGGEQGHEPEARILEEPLSAERLTRVVQTDSSGAVVLFQGTTRDVERLDYEAYVPMAEERIAAILADALEAHDIENAAAEHRIGAVPLGESSVIVAISAAHRGPAFAAAREVIDRIKAEAPIWKREVESEGAAWVEGSLPPTG